MIFISYLRLVLLHQKIKKSLNGTNITIKLITELEVHTLRSSGVPIDYATFFIRFICT